MKSIYCALLCMSAISESAPAAQATRAAPSHESRTVEAIINADGSVRVCGRTVGAGDPLALVAAAMWCRGEGRTLPQTRLDPGSVRIDLDPLIRPTYGSGAPPRPRPGAIVPVPAPTGNPRLDELSPRLYENGIVVRESGPG